MAAASSVGITGAYGYVGSLLRRAFEDAGWRTVALVRTPRPGDAAARRFDLSSEAWAADLLAGLDVVVHAAWDFGVSGREEVWAVNVRGSLRLLQRADPVARVIVVSSMSAFAGTRQVYGQAKLAVEDEALGRGGIVIRPGLVYGPDAGGMAGALTKLARLPVVPVVTGASRQFPVHADDLAAAVLALAAASGPGPGPIGVAQGEPVSFAALLRALSPRRTGPRTVAVPWQLPYVGLRLAERAGLSLPFRSDSLLGLVRAAPSVPNLDFLASLGVQPRALVDPRSGDRNERR